ncbi:hypothetical protein JTB14_011900 [Gonioctena quinquepunctata]|nr:hypothetical protein JTB14_011900 [Gonioctena quinquepunctata]
MSGKFLKFKYKIRGSNIPEDIRNAVSEYLEGKKPENVTIEIDQNDGTFLSDGLRKILEREVARMETMDDFADKVEDNESEQFRHMIPNLEPSTQQELLWLEYGYKGQKMLNMLDTIEYTLEGNKYKPPKSHPNIYRDEHQILEMIYWEGKYDEEKRGKLMKIYDQLCETGSYTSTSTSDDTEETSGERECTSSPPESAGKGEIDPKTNTTKAANTSAKTNPEVKWTEEQQQFAFKIALFTLGHETFQELFSEICNTRLDGQTDNSVEETATNTSPKEPPSCLYPTVVIKTKVDGQAHGKDIITELSPDEEKVRDRKPKTKSVTQIDGPTDPSSDDKSIEDGSHGENQE